MTPSQAPPGSYAQRSTNEPTRRTATLVEGLADVASQLAGEDAPGFLWNLCTQLGVRGVEMQDSLSGLDGRTEWRSDGPYIQLSRDRPAWCVTSVFAHELIHVLLARHDLYGSQLGCRLDTGGIAEEQLCNDVSSATMSRLRFLCPLH
jgi:hypothetical protein